MKAHHHIPVGQLHRMMIDTSPGGSRASDDGRKSLKLKLRDQVRKQAKARERGANPAPRKRGLDLVKSSLVKMWLVFTGC